MSYDIELISIGEDLYPILGSSASMLNAVQNEFRFRLASSRVREEGLSFNRNQYSTAEIWQFLKEQRLSFGGNRPFIIAFLNRPLQSTQYKNIFGSHEGDDGLAVVTLHSSTQYVKEAKRYCCYYLTRYAMSFVNPLIRAHNDPDRSACYFHAKVYKPEIRLSMDSGTICDEDMRQLDNPPAGSSARRLSHLEREALSKMRQVVRGDYPHALVMKGGGVKGLAFAGALLELERYFWFDRHVGTSAGAIAAALLAGGYSPAELVELLGKKDFREFMDAPFWKLPFNILFRWGLYPGEHFREWIGSLLRAKISKQGDILMSDLNGAVFYASTRGTGNMVFDSSGSRKDITASYAVRCSMSIPVFFIAAELEGRKIYDGGLRSNFPVARFLADHPNTPFIGLYLTPTVKRGRGWMGSDLLEIVVEGDERSVVDGHPFDMVLIDPSPVNTTNFRLHALEKEFLLKVGRAAALKFLVSRNFDDGPDLSTVESATREAEECRERVRSLRRRNSKRRLIAIAIVIAAMLIIGILISSHLFARITSAF